MGNACSHQGKNERQWNKSKHKTCYHEVSGYGPANKETEEKYKKVCCTCKVPVVVVVLLIKPLFCRCRCGRRLVYAILFFA